MFQKIDLREVEHFGVLDYPGSLVKDIASTDVII